ncbi:MAG: hypothetical protein ABSD74_19045 [Rhizomicrobium sp.]|jgi:hypothetical protein
MSKIALLAAASAIAISAGSQAAVQSPVQSSRGFDVHATRLSITVPGVKTLYSQNNDDAGVAVISQNFESSMSIYDAQGADDFVVPKGKTWTVEEVDITGVYFNGSGPAASENVTFYADSNGLPGKQIAAITKAKGADNGGSFAIKIHAVKLKPGHYWVSVGANCSFVTCGEWGWELRSVQANDMAAYQAPGGSGPCTTWQPLDVCFGNGTPPDFMFALKGSK